MRVMFLRRYLMLAIILLITGVILLLMTVVREDGSTVDRRDDSAYYEVRIGHLESPLQPRHQALEQVSILVKERTNGAVIFKLFPSRQLGNARQMNEGVQLGTIEGTISPASFLSGFNPVVSILDIPFLLPDDRTQATQLRQGDFGQALLESFESRKFKAIALWPNGRKNLTSNKPLESIDDLGQQHFRVMDSRILIEQFTAFRASAISLPFGELYNSLQLGVVDGQENPLDTIERMKFYEVQQYLMLSEHGALEDVVLFNLAWWNQLPEDYQDVIIAAFHEVIPALERNKEQAQVRALQVIEEAGLTVTKLSVDEQQQLRELSYQPTRQAYLEYVGMEGEQILLLYEREYQRILQSPHP